jgi:cytochrome c oxidase cbb3-type subunit 2
LVLGKDEIVTRDEILNMPAGREMDALIAYLQVLGTMVDFSTFQPDPTR